MKISSSQQTLPFEAEDVLRVLAFRVRVARRARGLTQLDLAVKAGISPSRLVAIEKGAPNVQMGYWLSVLWALDLLQGFAGQVEGLGREAGDLALLEARLPRRVRGRKSR